jgi:hypothetical protein
MITTQFYVYTDATSTETTDLITLRFKVDYPDTTSEINYNEEEELLTITLKNDLDDIEKIDTFLCEEICKEFEYYCSISSESSSKSYYFDEEDEWIYKD